VKWRKKKLVRQNKWKRRSLYIQSKQQNGELKTPGEMIRETRAIS
jgi:hypothetical protein